MVYCKDGMILKFGGEQTIRPLRVIVYMLGLGWSFLAVAIIADVFMGAIEKITSKKKRKWVSEKNRYVTSMVWNPTVANLTLMALGSSAPEILLNCIEIVKDDFFLGGLGPSTIVGSAAFNLLCIVAVCISAIPSTEVRAIKETGVYWLTAIISVFAYLWLIIIVIGRSKYVIEPWEGCLTFLFFPVLVMAAYTVDRNFFREDTDTRRVISADLTKEELAEMEKQIVKDHGPNLAPEQMAKFVQTICGDKRSRAQYRIAATRGLTGGKRVRTATSTFQAKAGQLVRAMTSGFGSKRVVPMKVDKAFIEFPVVKHAVLESAGSVTVTVTRTGALGLPVSVQYKTRQGSAKANTDYEHVEGVLMFGPNETEQKITVKIVDDVTYEEDEEFYIDLAMSSQAEEAELGNKSLTVLIVDDDMPGKLSFPEDEVHVMEEDHEKEVSFLVQRTNGSSGRIICRYHTEDDTATAGVDYEQVEGELVFENTQMSAFIKLNIKAVGRYDRQEQFRLLLDWPEDDKKRGGSSFVAETDGGEDCCILTVVIEGNYHSKARVDGIMTALESSWAKSKVGSANWAEQFTAAFFVNGGDESDEQSQPSTSDWILHVVSLPWKLLFALCPPTNYGGGWCTFCVSLAFIGLVTALISDLAGLLGCSMGMCDSVTAITFVALGTSLPDTFASKTAAEQDPTADASIVNVTGSNSVNVFLGLGLPWMAASFKWQITGATPRWTALYGSDVHIPSVYKLDGGAAFIVKDDSLANSVTAFTVCAVMCICLLSFRRWRYGGELGGPRGPKLFSSLFLFGLWVCYVTYSALGATC